MRMRVAGATFTQIAAELGISQPSAFNLVKRQIEARRRAIDENVDDLRQLQADRLETLWAALFYGAGIGRTEVVDGKRVNLPPDLEVVDRLLKVSKQQADLHGLDAPTKIDYQGIDAEANEFGSIVASIAIKFIDEDKRAMFIAEVRAAVEARVGKRAVVADQVVNQDGESEPVDAQIDAPALPSEGSDVQPETPDTGSGNEQTNG